MDALKLNIFIFFSRILYVESEYHNRYLEKCVFLEICAFKVIIRYLLATEKNSKTLNFYIFNSLLPEFFFSEFFRDIA